MRQRVWVAAAIATVVTIGAPAGAQQIADAGFKSVGRGWPVKADLRKYEVVGATIPVEFENGKVTEDPKGFAGAARDGKVPGELRRRRSVRFHRMRADDLPAERPGDARLAGPTDSI